MRAFLLVTALLLSGSSAYAASCGGQTTQCYSQCDRGYVPVAGNKCETFYDSGRRCYSVRGNCQDNGHGNTGCRGKSTSCYSQCDRGYKRVQNADSCTTAYNSTKRCYDAVGYCKN